MLRARTYQSMPTIQFATQKKAVNRGEGGRTKEIENSRQIWIPKRYNLIFFSFFFYPKYSFLVLCLVAKQSSVVSYWPVTSGSATMVERLRYFGGGLGNVLRRPPWLGLFASLFFPKPVWKTI